MDRTHLHDPYGRPLRPWADPLLDTPSADTPYSVLPPEEPPVLAELADDSDAPPPRKIELLDDPSLDQPPTDADASERRFSLFGLMVLMTAAAVLFALMGQLPRPIFAGAAGGLSLLMLACLSLVEVQNPLFRYGWWLLFLTYLIASGTAAVTG